MKTYYETMRKGLVLVEPLSINEARTRVTVRVRRTKGAYTCGEILVIPPCHLVEKASYQPRYNIMVQTASTFDLPTTQAMIDVVPPVQ